MVFLPASGVDSGSSETNLPNTTLAGIGTPSSRPNFGSLYRGIIQNLNPTMFPRKCRLSSGIASAKLGAETPVVFLALSRRRIRPGAPHSVGRHDGSESDLILVTVSEDRT